MQSVSVLHEHVVVAPVVQQHAVRSLVAQPIVVPRQAPWHGRRSSGGSPMPPPANAGAAIAPIATPAATYVNTARARS